LADQIPQIVGARSGETDMTILEATADWHATMALKAYRKRDYETYVRHIRIADDLRFCADQAKVGL
jgi:hypothetical protein